MKRHILNNNREELILKAPYSIYLLPLLPGKVNYKKKTKKQNKLARSQEKSVFSPLFTAAHKKKG